MPAVGSSSLLELVTIEVPCTAPWETMIGDARTRFCSQCQLQVHNIAEMTRAEAETLLASRAGQRLCGRIYRRPDGTVMARDCFSVRRATRHAVAFTVSIAAGLFLTIAGWTAWAFAVPSAQNERRSPRDVEPFRTVLNWLDPPQCETLGAMITPTVATQLWTEPEDSTEAEQAN